MPPWGLGRTLGRGWPGRKPRLAGRLLRGKSSFHASPPARLASSFTLKGRPGQWVDTSAIPSLQRMSQALQSHTQPAAAGPHLALAQGMIACMLSQGGDFWALALQEIGVGLLYIRNPLQKSSGVTLMFLPQQQFPWRMDWVQPQDPQRNSLAPHPLPAFRRLVRVPPRVKGELQPQLPCPGVARKRRKRPSGFSTVLCARWQ